MSERTAKTAEWMYRGIWRGLVNWFRVPDEPPTLPVKAGEFIHSFPPDKAFLKYMKFWFWVVLGISDIALAVGYIAASIAFIMSGWWWMAVILFPVAVILIVVPDIFAFISIHLRYDTMWYVMTERSLRIRRGIWIIHETTITFDNIQNLKVQQGPLQRHYGIANLVVETAGSGGAPNQKGAGGVSNRGIIEGIANANEIRDRILVRMKQSQGAGLNDDGAEGDRAGLMWTPAHLDALRDIHSEIRAIASART